MWQRQRQKRAATDRPSDRPTEPRSLCSLSRPSDNPLQKLSLLSALELLYYVSARSQDSSLSPSRSPSRSRLNPLGIKRWTSVSFVCSRRRSSCRFATELCSCCLSCSQLLWGQLKLSLCFKRPTPSRTTDDCLAYSQTGCWALAQPWLELLCCAVGCLRLFLLVPAASSARAQPLPLARRAGVGSLPPFSYFNWNAQQHN